MSDSLTLMSAAAGKEYKRLKANMDSAIHKAIRNLKKSQEWRDSSAEQKEMMLLVDREQIEEKYYAQGKHPLQVPGLEDQSHLDGITQAAVQIGEVIDDPSRQDIDAMPASERSFTPVNLRRSDRTTISAAEQRHVLAQSTERKDSNGDQAGGRIQVLPEGAGVHHQAAQGITLSVPIDYRGTITFAPGQ
ncbi:hypothetical protein KVT40_001700 [Elsinoe batatas]|uniref:Uncharacterized protein n=1 Tax=Elsinoe batatas TaxID=2601811 RepID=A0A8K0L967_9PEZI|nr:hypothetical protein KVT40_001700 [Elsinoe batatas]